MSWQDPLAAKFEGEDLSIDEQRDANLAEEVFDLLLGCAMADEPDPFERAADQEELEAARIRKVVRAVLRREPSPREWMRAWAAWMSEERP